MKEKGTGGSIEIGGLRFEESGGRMQALRCDDNTTASGYYDACAVLEKDLRNLRIQAKAAGPQLSADFLKKISKGLEVAKIADDEDWKMCAEIFAPKNLVDSREGGKAGEKNQNRGTAINATYTLLSRHSDLSPSSIKTTRSREKKRRQAALKKSAKQGKIPNSQP